MAAQTHKQWREAEWGLFSYFFPSFKLATVKHTTFVPIPSHGVSSFYIESTLIYAKSGQSVLLFSYFAYEKFLLTGIPECDNIPARVIIPICKTNTEVQT